MLALRRLRYRAARYPAQRRHARQVDAILRQVRPYSMVPDAGIRFVIEATQRVLDRGVVGDFVECGVWQGGCSAAMLLAQHRFQPGQPRGLHLFDSFEGLPPAQEIDGRAALEWQQNVEDPLYYDNCVAPLEQVQANFERLGLHGTQVQFYKGWFDSTIPQFVRDHPALQIAVLRLDGDWYESTKVCIENLYDLVAPQGIVIIDDYYTWDGCALAIHEFLGSRHLKHPLRSAPEFSAAYFEKEP